ncbi:hypothetical protein D3C85_602900 [compost metagenome]
MQARGHHHPSALPGRDQRAAVGHWRSVPQRGVGGDGVCVLFHGHGFPGQHGFLYPQGMRRQQAYIRRNPIARLQQHDIAGHQGFARDAAALAVAQDVGAWRQHLADGRHRFLCLAFLNKTDDGVRQDHGQDDAGIDAMSQKRGDGGRAQQHVDKNVVKLCKKAAERAALARNR